jgi:tRNA A-37 threonylcarbamoyl transferase component Bud32/AAA+ ATPase superfamily predicted ATPase
VTPANRLGNPFICGGPVPPSHFIGREREVQIIFDQITSHALGSIAICGDRRIGKTSLLQYVYHPDILEKWGLPQDKYLFLFLDSQSISEFTPSRFWRRLLTLLLREKKGNLPPEMIEGILARKEIGHTDFEIVLDEINRRGQVLILLLDELEWVIRTDNDNEPVTRDFLSALRALMNRTPKALVLVVATCRELHELCRPIKFIGSPFDNEFTFRRLRPFTRKEIDQLLDNALERTGMEFTPEERDYICSLAGPHPFLIQLAGSTLFEFRMQGLETAPNSELIRAEFEELARYHLSQLWENCSREEQMLLTVLALKRLGEREESKWTYNGAAFERIFNRHERTLVDLLKRGLIAPVKKTIAVCPGTFESWVLREIRSADEEEFAKRETLMFDLLPRDEAEQVTNVMRLISDRADVRLGRTDWKRIGRYEIIEELGRGAMSIVYKARDPNIARVVTLKVMRLDWEARSEKSKKRFRHEAMSAGQLPHPNIVAVYDAGEYRGEPYIVMEYLEGPTLAKVLKAQAPLPLERAVDIALQIGDALDYAHQRGVIHRDVNPSNIILLESSQVKVTDFGLAKLVSDSAPDASQSGVFHGTLDYASPEQILGLDVDGRSDIFSLGVIVYEMLTCERPFRGKNITAVILRLLSEEPLPLTALGPHLPLELKDILSKAMAKDVTQRYQTCAELGQDLRKMISRRGSGEE